MKAQVRFLVLGLLLYSAISGCAANVSGTKNYPPGYQQQAPDPVGIFLRDNLHYPDTARVHCIHGDVCVQFTINENGIKSGASIEKSLSADCDAEALRVINSMPASMFNKQKGQAGSVMFKQLVSFKLEDTTRDKDPKSNVYNYVDQQPVAGYNVRDYIQRNLKYPEAAKQANIEGSVPVKFVVNEDGHISDAMLLRTIGGGYDEEALRVISGMPPWLPGEQNGKKVKVYVAELVTFANTAR